MPSKKELEYEKVYDFLCVELLKKFTERELEGLTYFVNCEYFNWDKYVIKLLKNIRLHVLSKNNFTQKVYCIVYEKVFSEKPAGADLNEVQKKRLNNKMNLLLRLVEEFLMVEALRDNPTHRSDLLYQKVLEKRHFILFNRHAKRTKKRLESTVIEDIGYYEQRYKIEHHVLESLYLSNKIYEKDNLPDLIYYLDINYFINKLSLYITLLTLKGVTQKNYDTASMEATLRLLKTSEYKEHPLIQVYLATINLMKNQSEAAYRNLLELLDCHASSISRKDLNGFYIGVTNFCARQIKAGKFGYEEWFNLYRIVDDKNLMLEDALMPILKLKNAVVAACRVKEFDWAMKMIEKYQPFIEKSVQESVYHFNLGVVAFYQKDYKKALHHFVRVESVNFNYDVNCRVIMMKAHYETDQEYDERTLQIFRSTEKYFNENQQLTKRNRTAYKNFIRTLINVYRVRHRATKMKLENIKDKLERQEVNSDKQWLMDKVEELS